MSMTTYKRLSCLALMALLAGCGRTVTSTPGDAPNLELAAEVRARPASPLDPLPVMQQFETFEYAAQGMRDPFSDAWTNPTAAMACARTRTAARNRWKPSRSTVSTCSGASAAAPVWLRWSWRLTR